jgi:hypothetical protein
MTTVYLLHHSYGFTLPAPGMSSVHSIYSSYEKAHSAGISLVMETVDCTLNEAAHELETVNDYFYIEEREVIC